MTLLRYPFLALFVFCSVCVSAQIADDFSDGNFTENPQWTGDAGNFVVNPAGQLQLNAPSAGASVLVTEGNIADSSIWQVFINLKFAPSNSNQLRIYLLADQPDVLTANGYYLEIGETGSMDALRFFRQDNSSSTLLWTGTPGLVAADPVEGRLRVKRTVSGEWSFEWAAGSGPFQPEGSVTDLSYGGGMSRYFGFYCIYTATRVNAFYFDDLSILPDLPDTQAPVLLTAVVEDNTHLRLGFDESLDPGAAEDESGYTISGIGQPADAALQPDGQTVRLTLAQALATGSYQVTATGIADLAGNESGAQTLDFSYIDIQAATEFDILINEIMADPTPGAGLPDAEWVELYNRSAKIIDLSTLQFADSGDPRPLPAYLLYPDSFVVLCSPAGFAALQGSALNTLAVAGFPGLNNSGEPLSLSTQSGDLIDQVVFADVWHEEIAKRDGGWSLERINPLLPCLGRGNWQSCPVLPGGTPGRANASLALSADQEAPRLLSVYPTSNATLELQFSEGLDVVSAADPGSYLIEPGIGVQIAQVSVLDRTRVLLLLDAPLSGGIVYAVTATSDLIDCSGNSATTSDTAFVGLVEIPEWQDILVNEILFNPLPGGSRFVEFYNNSQKVFSWEDLFLGNFSAGSDVEPVGIRRLFFPGEYFVVTEDPAYLAAVYPQHQADQVLDTDLPSLSDDRGNITLFWTRDGQAVTVDSFDYEASFHNPLFTSSEREGVSLERIRFGESTNAASNWSSAAGPPRGPSGTPTLPNSQRLPSAVLQGSLLDIPNPRFSPDADGFEDFLEIRYQLPEPGYAATITIFDAGGQPVRKLVRQDLVGTEGFLRWDGEADNGAKIRPGIYVVFAEVFRSDGKVDSMKKPVAVVGNLK